ncbi:MAG: acireductone synthase [Myxococcales bacterium]|nr:acireductone synthase [Myxococcales bacterium]MBK7197895.1 acireductone synthase [Myxococcales bacterium]MBP6846491.1 acireductone synthase [Kofleriaceae bacterium]
MTVALAVAAVVLDVEGTTAPIAFVHDVLFPYAAARLDEFVAARGAEPAVAAALATLAAERAADREVAAPDLIAYARALMARDRKSTGLKALQGLIWHDGYLAGALRGELYADVGPAFVAWRAAGVTIASYSSGSIAAQRLIYAHSDRGDLTAHLAAYFDTTTGPKQAPASYAAIATALALPPARIAFVSDVVAELAAAAAAGMHAVLSVRPGNAPVAPGHGYPTIGTLDELALRPA